MDDRTECSELADLLAEVATGAASGPDRARALRHLNGCDNCRHELDELTRVADEVLLITPEHESPAGFEGAVLDRISALAAPVEPVRRSRWFVRPILSAVAAGVFAVAGAGVVWQATSDDRELAASFQGTLDVAGGRYFSAANLVGPGGASAGTVFFYDGSPSWLFFVVRDAPAGPYDVVVTTGRRSTTVATCTVENGTCAVGVTVDAGTYPVDEVRLRSATGTTLRSE